MSARISWSREAISDVERIGRFLLEHHPGLAPRLAERLADGVDRLGDMPGLGRLVQSGRRRATLTVLRGRYLIDYAIVDEGIVILRVRHSKERRE